MVRGYASKMLGACCTASLARVLTLGPALVLGAALAGCASTVGDTLPSQMGGLPAGTPERPADAAPYPAVHDMPPPRHDVVLTVEERKKATDELMALRARQEKAAGTTAAAAAAATAGATRNPPPQQ
jgi:hypothetical protein